MSEEPRRNGNGRAGNLLEALKTILMSPVGGWAIAIGVVAYMGWFTMEDRKVMYHDLLRFRTETAPLVMSLKETAEETREIAMNNAKITEEAKHISENSYEILQQIRSMMNIPLENRSDLKEMLKQMKKQENQQ